MDRTRDVAHSLLLLLLPLALLVACAEPPAPEEGDVPLVVVTIHPVADLARTLAGEAAHVRTLLPPRASIHTWEATPAQIRRLSQAAGYVTLGGGLDGWLDGIAAGPNGPRTLRLTEGMDLKAADHGHGDEEPGSAEEHEGTGDPHVWLDPLLVRDELVPRLRDFLVEVAPDQEVAIRERASAFADSLTALDAEIRHLLAGARKRAFVATHEAWAYFAERYDLTSLGSLYESPGHEPSARGLARLVDAARAAGVGAVLTEPQLAETAAHALAGEIAARVIVVDPLGGADVEGRENYLDLMRFNARAFARALESP